MRKVLNIITLPLQLLGVILMGIGFIFVLIGQALVDKLV